ncbi:MAG: hypothetical protein P8H23_00430 [Flavobacteriaceae bacterium]|jgi:hypothetical protein|nr:hypothetical protein [Flavobacteriaceae bacterium]
MLADIFMALELIGTPINSLMLGQILLLLRKQISEYKWTMQEKNSGLLLKAMI